MAWYYGTLIELAAKRHSVNQFIAWTGRAGASGNVLINQEADRVNSYNIWNFAEGHKSYYSAMLVDLTQPPDKVSNLWPIIIKI